MRVRASHGVRPKRVNEACPLPPPLQIVRHSRTLRAAGLDGLRRLRGATDLDAVRLGLRLLVDAARSSQVLVSAYQVLTDSASHAPHAEAAVVELGVHLAHVAALRKAQRARVHAGGAAESSATPVCQHAQRAPERAAGTVPLDVIARVLVWNLVVRAAVENLRQPTRPCRCRRRSRRNTQAEHA